MFKQHSHINLVVPLTCFFIIYSIIQGDSELAPGMAHKNTQKLLKKIELLEADIFAKT